MRLILQRVASASVSVEDKMISKINQGIVVLVGIMDDDTTEDIEWCVKKCLTIKLFNNWKDTVGAINGEILSVSQFTLGASFKKGTKPDFRKSMKTEEAKIMYNTFFKLLKEKHEGTFDGAFGKMMLVDIQNDGPVTFTLDSKSPL